MCQHNINKFVYYIIYYCLASAAVIIVIPPLIKYDNAWRYTFITETAKIVFLVVPSLLYLKLFEKVDVLSFIKLKTNHKTGIAWGIAIGLLWVCVNMAANILSKNKLANYNLRIDQWIGGILLVGFTEEITYRGVILQKLSSYAAFWKANMITAAMFAVLHIQVWFHLKYYPPLVLFLILLSLFCSGIAYGYLMKKTDSLWPCIILHSVYNFTTLVVRYA